MLTRALPPLLVDRDPRAASLLGEAVGETCPQKRYPVTRKRHGRDSAPQSGTLRHREPSSGTVKPSARVPFEARSQPHQLPTPRSFSFLVATWQRWPWPSGKQRACARALSCCVLGACGGCRCLAGAQLIGPGALPARGSPGADPQRTSPKPKLTASTRDHGADFEKRPRLEACSAKTGST